MPITSWESTGCVWHWKPIRKRKNPTDSGWTPNWTSKAAGRKKLDTHMGVHTLYMRERNGNMEKAFAYICASEEATPRLLKRYCRKVYELGYVPICPALADGQYLQTENPDEKRQFQSIARQKLGRCRMLVVCGNEISHAMSGEIGLAEKRNLICTTLDGLAKIKEADENGGL